MTQTRKEALTDLLAKVEAGERPRQDGTFYRLFGDKWVHCWDVMHLDSIDAAKALHEAVLPGWVYCLGSHDLDKGPPSPFAAVSPMVSTQPFEAFGTSPARAWLIAILKALIAQEPDQ